MKISDEVVLAATQVIRAHDNEQWGEDCGDEPYKELVSNMLTSALPHSQTGYEVKKLEWLETFSDIFRAKTAFGTYIISPSDRGGFYWTIHGVVVGHSQSVKEAKASAQADFVRRVRECIVGGVDVSVVRRKALEEAANICDQSSALSQEQRGEVGKFTHISAVLNGEVVAAKVLAKRIRALSATPFEKKKARLPDKEEVLLDILSDIKPHLGAWRAALLMAERAAVSSPPDIDDKAYWRHEIKALDAILGKLNALVGKPAEEAER